MIIAKMPENENERMNELRAYHILDTRFEAEFDRVTELVSIIFNVPTVLVSLVDSERQWFKSKVGVEACETKRDYAICSHAILSPNVFVVNDATKDERFFDNPLVVELGIVFYAGAPLITQSGVRLGTLCMIDSKKRDFSHHELNILRILAKHVVYLMEVRRKNKELDDLIEAFYQEKSLSLKDSYVNSLLQDAKSGSFFQIPQDEDHRELQKIQEESGVSIIEYLELEKVMAKINELVKVATFFVP